MERYIYGTPKSTSFCGEMSHNAKTSYNAQIIKTGPPVRPVHVTKRPKKTQRIKPYSGKLDIRPDHPRRRMEIVWRGGWSSWSSCKFQVSSKSAERLPRSEEAHTITLTNGLYNSPYSLPYRHDIKKHTKTNEKSDLPECQISPFPPYAATHISAHKHTHCFNQRWSVHAIIL